MKTSFYRLAKGQSYILGVREQLRPLHFVEPVGPAKLFLSPEGTQLILKEEEGTVAWKPQCLEAKV